MLVRDLEYMEVASSSEIEGGYAFAFATAGPSTASGINVAAVRDVTATATLSTLQVGPVGPIGFNTATSGALSESYSS